MLTRMVRRRRHRTERNWRKVNGRSLLRERAVAGEWGGRCRRYGAPRSGADVRFVLCVGCHIRSLVPVTRAPGRLVTATRRGAAVVESVVTVVGHLEPQSGGPVPGE